MEKIPHCPSDPMDETKPKSIHPTHIYMIAYFPDMVQAFQ